MSARSSAPDNSGAQKQQAKRFRDILNKERPDSRKDAATATNHSA